LPRIKLDKNRVEAGRWKWAPLYSDVLDTNKEIQLLKTNGSSRFKK